MKYLVSSPKHDRLELNGQELHCGDVLEIRILGSWIAGVLARDRSGWYFVTQEQSEVRLHAGLEGRILHRSPPSSSPPHPSSTE